MEFKVGDQVLLSTQNHNFNSQCDLKLSPRSLNNWLFRSMNLDWLTSQPCLNPCVVIMYHVSLLRKFNAVNRVQPPPPPVEVKNGQAFWEVESSLHTNLVLLNLIRRSRRIRSSGRVTLFGTTPTNQQTMSWRMHPSSLKFTGELKTCSQSIAEYSNQL